jgi:hypothetical protein
LGTVEAVRYLGNIRLQSRQSGIQVTFGYSLGSEVFR